MKATMTPSLPPSVPYLSREGAEKKQVGDTLLIVQTKNANQGTLKTSFVEILPSKAFLLSQHP